MAINVQQTAVNGTVGGAAMANERILTVDMLQAYEVLGLSIGVWLFILGAIITVYTFGKVALEMFRSLRRLYSRITQQDAIEPQ